MAASREITHKSTPNIAIPFPFDRAPKLKAPNAKPVSAKIINPAMVSLSQDDSSKNIRVHRTPINSEMLDILTLPVGNLLIDSSAEFWIAPQNGHNGAVS